MLLNLASIFSTAVARASTNSRLNLVPRDGSPSRVCTTPSVFFNIESGSAGLGLPAPFMRSFNAAASLPAGVKSSVLPN